LYRFDRNDITGVGAADDVLFRESDMRTPWKFLAPVLIAASVPCIAGSAAAAPLSPSLALKSADGAAVIADAGSVRERVSWPAR
jgi:hypothetical protein